MASHHHTAAIAPSETSRSASGVRRKSVPSSARVRRLPARTPSAKWATPARPRSPRRIPAAAVRPGLRFVTLLDKIPITGHWIERDFSAALETHLDAITSASAGSRGSAAEILGNSCGDGCSSPKCGPAAVRRHLAVLPCPPGRPRWRLRPERGRPPRPGKAAASRRRRQGCARRKTDEFAEAAQAINGPAGNPECVWLGRRAVQSDVAGRPRYRLPPPRSLRPLRLPRRPHPGRVPLPDPLRRPDRSQGRRTLNSRVHACWINPALSRSRRRPPPQPAPPDHRRGPSRSRPRHRAATSLRPQPPAGSISARSELHACVAGDQKGHALIRTWRHDSCETARQRYACICRGLGRISGTDPLPCPLSPFWFSRDARCRRRSVACVRAPRRPLGRLCNTSNTRPTSRACCRAFPMRRSSPGHDRRQQRRPRQDPRRPEKARAPSRGPIRPYSSTGRQRAGAADRRRVRPQGHGRCLDRQGQGAQRARDQAGASISRASATATSTASSSATKRSTAATRRSKTSSR